MSSADTEALRALADEDPLYTRDWVDDAQDEMRAAADTIAALRAEVAQLIQARDGLNGAVRQWTRIAEGAEAERDEYRFRAEAAERAIADAPHARDCWHYGVVANGAEHVGPCTCWKAEYARASQPAPTEGDAS